MNKKAFFLGFFSFVSLAASAGGGGTINFANKVTMAGIDAPVYDLDGSTRLEGERYAAILFAGPTADELLPVGEPARFSIKGYWSAKPNSARILPNVAPGEYAVIQVRVWDTTGGATFEEAEAANAKTGVSSLLTVKTGGDGLPPSVPADLVGLQSFHLEQGPVFIRQPGNLTLYAGQAGVFEVEVSSQTPVAFQWQFNGADLPGAASATLNLGPVSPSQAGAYRVLARNDTRTTASEQAVLTVTVAPAGASLLFRNRVPEAGLDAPVFDTDGTTLLEGSNFVAQVYAGLTADDLEPAGDPVPFGVGSEAGYFAAGDEFWRTVSEAPPGSKLFVQIKVWEKAAGETFEEAKAAEGKIGASGVIEVTSGGAGDPPAPPAVLLGLTSFHLGRMPVISQHPVTVRVLPGENAVFEVKVAGADQVKYQWYFNGTALPGATAERLTVSGVSAASIGAYHVVVTSPIGSVTSKDALLYLRGGTIYFANRVPPAGLDAPVFDLDGKTLLEGARYVAMLYAGSTADGLTAQGVTAPFSSAARAGYWDAWPNNVVTLDSIAPGYTAFVQVRVWEVSLGSSYEAAWSANAKTGISSVFSVVTGGAGEPPTVPADLIGLASFSLQQGPVFTEWPESARVFVGETVVLDAMVTSQTEVFFQWQFNGSNIPGATSSTLDLGPAQIAHSGVYRLKATNSSRTTTTPEVAVEVIPVPLGALLLFRNRVPEAGLDAPVFDFDGTSLLEGDSFVAQVYAGLTAEDLKPVGAPVPFGVGADAGYFAAGGEFWRTVPEAAPGSKVNVQIRVWESAAGETYEKARQSGGKSGASSILEIVSGGGGDPPALPAALTGLTSFRLVQPPVFVRQPVGGVVQLGQSWNFRVEVQSQSPAGFQWYLNDGAISGATDARLDLAGIGFDKGGTYRVVATSVDGSTSSLGAELKVTDVTSGGTVLFSNRVPGDGVNAPIFDVNGTTKLAGPDFVAGLYVGPSPTELVMAGSPLPFRTMPYEGFLQETVITAPNLAPGVVGYALVRAWQGATQAYDQAVLAGAKHGESDMFTFVAGGLGDPPTQPGRLTNLRSFRLKQAPVILAQTGSIIVDEGQEVQLQVQVTSHQPVTYQWEKLGEGGAWDVVPGSTTDTLQLGVLSKANDMDTYHAVVSNADGTTSGEPMTVHVAAQVRLNPPGWQALRLELSGEGGPVYTIESTINLRNWQPLKTVTNETLALDFSDASADGLFARFYRARSEATGKVVSTSAVGFVELDIPYGFSMRANPLITDQNTVGSLLKGVPAGIMVYKYISGVNFSVNGFEDGAWDRPEESFGPGEGLFVRNGTIDTYWLSIVGKVPEGTLSVSIPVGWSILSSPLPKAGRADTILGCPFERGDNVHRYITELYQYEGHAYAGNGVWQIGGPPEIEFGEAFWVWTKRAATWTVTFSSKE